MALPEVRKGWTKFLQMIEPLHYNGQYLDVPIPAQMPQLAGKQSGASDQENQGDSPGE